MNSLQQSIFFFKQDDVICCGQPEVRCWELDQKRKKSSFPDSRHCTALGTSYTIVLDSILLIILSVYSSLIDNDLRTKKKKKTECAGSIILKEEPALRRAEVQQLLLFCCSQGRITRPFFFKRWRIPNCKREKTNLVELCV